ncbi:TAXI family TRAP transporter solute-binding subunit, partial [Chloroflexota bacterium]
SIAVADIINKNVPGVEGIVEPVSGTDEALLRLAKGDFDMSNLPASKFYKGLFAEAPYEAAPKDAYRLMLLSYHQPVTLVVRADSDIQSIADFKGKRIAMGGATHRELAETWLGVFATQGITEADLFMLPRGEKEADIPKLVEGKVDVIIMTGGIPVTALVEAMKTTPMRVIPLTPEEQAAAAPRRYFPTTVPAGAYPGQDQDVPVLSGGRGHFSIRKDLPDDLVYAITKAIFEHMDQIQSVHVSFRVIIPESALDTVWLKGPVHPGAIKYVTEAGLWSDDDVKTNQEILADIQSKL